MFPDIDKDLFLDGDSSRISTLFWYIISDFPGATKATKGRMVRQFESLSLNNKAELLDKLNEADDNYRRYKITEHFLIAHADDEGYTYSNGVKLNATGRAIRPQQQVATEREIEVEVKIEPERKESSAFEELKKLTGLKAVKDQIEALIAFIEMSKLRKQHGLKSKDHVLHMMFKGNPGTGKTTVARLLGQIFKEIGILPSGHVIEIDRADLISKYQGEIEQKVTNYVVQAEGGILFIDEIYSLYKQGDNNDQGKQGVEVLLKAIEDKGHSFICIGAGYNEEVDTFLSSNPGLPSRFPIQIQFENYTEEELVSIAVQMFNDRDYKMDEGFEDKFKEVVAEEMENETFGNARVVRNIIESSIREQSLRLWKDKSKKTRDILMSVSKEDLKYVPVKLNPKEEKDKLDLLTELMLKDKSETA